MQQITSVDHTKNIIEIENVSFSYSGKKEDEVLSDVNLNIHQGDYLGIIGPNGGGKTTLLKLILGLLIPQSGTIKILGQTKIGYVPQKATNFDVNFPATVKEVVAMGRYAKIGLFKWPTSSDGQHVQEALKQVDMEEYAERLIGDLSGGQQQRVFIARALAAQPEVVFLDEPTAGIDQKNQEKFYDLLQKLNKELGITLVVVSHDIDVVAHEVTEIACINKTLIYDESPQQFLKKNALTDLYGKGVKVIDHNHHGH